MTVLRAGVAKADITPTRPLPLAGFAARAGLCEGVSRPLRLCAVALESVLGGGHARRALIVSADLIWWGSDRVPELRRQLEQRCGVVPELTILSATHNHSGPQTSHRFTALLGPLDDEYIALLESRLLDAAEQAFGELEPVRVLRGCGECRIGMNRRRRVGGEVINAPNPYGPSDPEVAVVSLATESGRGGATLVHFTCHPTTTQDNLISSEYPGVAMDLVESELGEGAVAAFLQGCCGDVNPRVTEGDRFRKGDDRDVRRLGETLGREVLRVLAKPREILDPVPLRGRVRIVDLPYRCVPDVRELERRSGEPGVAGQWARLLLSRPERLREPAMLELTRLDLAEGLSLLAMSGEIVVEYGLEVKRRSRGAMLPLGYSNGMIGYVPTARQTREGGYEAEGSVPFFDLPSPFDESVEGAVRGAISSLLA